MVKFMKHYVTNGKAKARVFYSSHTLHDGRACVTVYAKSFKDGRALAGIISEGYENRTDMLSDFFDEGHVRIPAGSPMYADALARCKA